MKTVDLTPAGFTGPKAAENAERANKAMDDMAKADAAFFLKMEEIISVCGGQGGFLTYLVKQGEMTKDEAHEYMAELDLIRAKRSEACEEMLRSVAGQPSATKPN